MLNVLGTFFQLRVTLTRIENAGIKHITRNKKKLSVEHNMHTCWNGVSVYTKLPGFLLVPVMIWCLGKYTVTPFSPRLSFLARSRGVTSKPRGSVTLIFGHALVILPLFTLQYVFSPGTPCCSKFVLDGSLLWLLFFKLWEGPRRLPAIRVVCV